MSESENSYPLLFDTRRSVRYHNRRRAFFDGLHSFVCAVSLICGSSVVASLLAQVTWLAILSGAIVSVLSYADLVVGSSQKARLHWDLARRFIELEKRIVRNPAPDAQTLQAMTETRLSIEADEPPVLRVLDSLCYNEMIKAEGHPIEKETTPIGRFQRLFAQWFDIAPDSIRLRA